MKTAEEYEQKLKELWKTYPYTNRSKNTASFQKYQRASARLDEEFKVALFAEYEVLNNPKAERCFSLAWEHGHSSGYNEVEIYFSEFVELIK